MKSGNVVALLALLCATSSPGEQRTVRPLDSETATYVFPGGTLPPLTEPADPQEDARRTARYHQSKQVNWQMRLDEISLTCDTSSGIGHVEYRVSSGSVDRRCVLHRTQNNGPWIAFRLKDSQGRVIREQRNAFVAWAPLQQSTCSSCGLYVRQRGQIDVAAVDCREARHVELVACSATSSDCPAP